MGRRWREPKAKPGELRVAWGRVEGGLDLGYAWGGSGADKCDSRILMRALEDNEVFAGKTLREELTARGYDITTLRFSIQRLAPPAEDRLDT